MDVAQIALESSVNSLSRGTNVSSDSSLGILSSVNRESGGRTVSVSSENIVSSGNSLSIVSSLSPSLNKNHLLRLYYSAFQPSSLVCLYVCLQFDVNHNIKTKIRLVS